MDDRAKSEMLAESTLPLVARDDSSPPDASSDLEAPDGEQLGQRTAESGRSLDHPLDHQDHPLAHAKPDDPNRAFALADLERRLFGTGASQPFRIGRFTVMEKLGTGGMGVVYAAFDPQLERKIAVKFLRSDLSEHEGRGTARLLREAQALARLDHPNVVSVFDVGPYEGGVYIAMEFVRGCSLGQWIADAQPPWRAILEAFVQAGSGLAAAHAAGIVHRDFKPDNVLRGDDGRVRVLDFGLAAATGDASGSTDEARAATGSNANLATPHTPAAAAELEPDSPPIPPPPPPDPTPGPRALEATAPAWDSSAGHAFGDPLTRTGAIMGTPLYMAPEQHAGRRSDARGDQFAFCVALWISLFGQRPFAGETLAALADAVQAGSLRAMPRTPRLPSRVRSAILRGLSVKPEDRFASIDDLLHELNVGGRRRRGLVAFGLGLVLAASATGIAAWQWNANRKPTLCEQAQVRAEQAWNAESWAEGRTSVTPSDADRTWSTLNERMGSHMQGWTRAHASVCNATAVDLEQLNCLEWRLQEIETYATVVTRSDPGDLHLVAQGINALVPAAACTDARAMSILPPPARDPQRRAAAQRLRTQIATASVLHKSGEHDQALRGAEAAVEAASELAEAAVEAESLLLLGEVLADAGRDEEAEQTLRKALRRAEAGSHDQVRGRALGGLIGVVGFRQGRPTLELEDRFESVSERISGLPSRALVDYLEAVTMVRIGHGRIEAAQEAAEAALKEINRLHLDPIKSEAQLGLALTLHGEYAAAQAVLDPALDRIDEQHPQAVLLLGICGIHRGFAGHDAQSVGFFRRALALEAKRKSSQPHYRALVGTYLANSIDRLGEPDRSIAMQRGAIADLKRLWGPTHGALGRAYHQFGTTLADNGHWEEAERAFEQSLEIWSVTHGLDHRAVAHPQTGRARVYLHRNQDEEALELLEGAARSLARGRGHPAEDARTFFHLARALRRTGGDSARAVAAALRAQSLLQGLGPGYERDRKAIGDWLETRLVP